MYRIILLSLWFGCRPPATGKDDTAHSHPLDDSGWHDVDTADSADISDTSDPEARQIFIAFGYPGGDEAVAVQMALTVLGADSADDGVTWTLDVSGVSWIVHIENTPENLSRGLETPGSIVVYGGHSNYGLGPWFADLPVDSVIYDVHAISDFYNMGTDLVAVYERGLLESQAYPNLEITTAEIPENPENYMIDGLDEERFPNDQGVGPGEAFTLRDTGQDRYHFTEDGTYRVIVDGGSADVPAKLGYDTLFIKSCHSGRYFWEVFDRGTLFYTRDNVEVESEELLPSVDLFVKGMILGWDADTIVASMNEREDIYEWGGRE